MKAIYFHYHANPGIIAGLVRWWLNTPYSHVSVEVDGQVYQSYWLKEFYKTPIRPKDIIDSQCIIVTDATNKQAAKLLDARLGSRYDHKSILSWIFSINHQAKKYWYCSEMANGVLKLITGDFVSYERMIKPEEIKSAVKFYLVGKRSTK